MNQLLLDTLQAAAKELGHPTTGDFANSLWITCSGHYGLDVKEAAKVYEACGYVPFSGYPLLRARQKAA
jgi:hypothetical protein